MTGREARCYKSTTNIDECTIPVHFNLTMRYKDEIASSSDVHYPSSLMILHFCSIAHYTSGTKRQPLLNCLQAQRQGTAFCPAPCPARNVSARGGPVRREGARGREPGRGLPTERRRGRRHVVQGGRRIRKEPRRILHGYCTLHTGNWFITVVSH